MRGFAIVAAALVCVPAGIGQTTSGHSTATRKEASKSTPAKSAVKSNPSAAAQKTTGKSTATNTAKKDIPSATAKSGVASKSASAAKSGTRASAGKSTAPKRPPAPRYYAQQQPTAERYREIQQALADRGYFHGTSDGAWGPESVEALKHFQADQNLDVDGKLGALSLIALGLGPRHENSSMKPVAPVVSERPADAVAEPPSSPQMSPLPTP